MLAQNRNQRLGSWWWTLLLVAISSIVGAGISGISEIQADQKQTFITPIKEVSPTAATSTAISRTQSGTSRLPTPKAKLADSTQKENQKIVRLFHPAPSVAKPLATDTNINDAPELAQMTKRDVEQLTYRNNALTFSDALRTLPAYDFNYEMRPAIRQRQSGMAAFGWAGQQGRNVENNMLQQQYGLGLSWQMDLLPQLELQLGAAMGYNNGFAYAIQRSDTSYVFGRTITTQSANVGNYLQLQLPVGLNYRITNKHSVEAGATYQRYLGSRYRLHTEIQGEDGTTTTGSAQLSGKISGLEIPAWSFYAGYRFQINETFDIGIRYQQQISPIRSFPAEKSFRIVLHYHLYRIDL